MHLFVVTLGRKEAVERIILAREPVKKPLVLSAEEVARFLEAVPALRDRVAGLMERMGLEDDMAIESRLVSKTIESAQSRVEGFNFDMRKRVVEFDDVINRQRETIYAERNKVLRNEDLTETVRGFLDDEVQALVADHLSGDSPDDWEASGTTRRSAASTSPRATA